jgi:dTDP-4-amino-4,6-dideoxygalactose transaminase
MKNFGFAGYDHVDYIGTNGKMSEISAAMGLTSLECMNDFITTNQRNYRLYQQGLADIPGICVTAYDETQPSNYQYIILEIDEASTGISRDQLQQILIAENILARRYFYPGCHRMEPYRSYFPYARLMLPETERLSNRVLSLPTGTAIEPDEIETICRLIRFVIDHRQEIGEFVFAPNFEANNYVTSSTLIYQPPLESLNRPD